jgi:hypothetical protein
MNLTKIFLKGFFQMQQTDPQILERHNKPSCGLSEKRPLQRIPEPNQHLYFPICHKTTR